MMGDQELRVIDAIVSLFETGKLPSPEAYQTVTLLPDKAGVTFGKHQTTAHAGGLAEVLAAYEAKGGLYAEQLAPYRPRLLETCDRKINPKRPPRWIVEFMDLLRKAGSDPKMQQAQDEVFEKKYRAPAFHYAQHLGLVEPLSYLSLYDVTIQSGLSRIDTLRPLFEALPPSKGGDERTWTSAFNAARRKWLENFTCAEPDRQRIIRRSAYRVVALQELERQGDKGWRLQPPLLVRGVTIL